MTPPPEHPTEEGRALGALTQLAREAAARPTPAELERGLHALFGRMAARQLRRARAIRISILAAAASVCAGIGLHWAAFRQPDGTHTALGYRIDGGSVLEGGYLRDSGGDGMRLFFDEGSKVVLEPGTRGRLRSTTGSDRRVVIDQGTASFEVARTKERRWLVEAGPFSVAVKGTQFTVSWSPSSEHFELRLRHGSVIVNGPITQGDIELRAGQRLVVDLPKAETWISEEPALHPGAAAPAGDPSGGASTAKTAGLVEPPTASPDAAITAPLSSRAAPRPDRKLAWSDQLASGHWNLILEEVDRTGVDATLEQVSSADLFALADAARYSRRMDLAHAALLAQRRRFPNSARSLDALFLLGRVEEARDKARAVAWYSAYMEQAVSGAYAAEASGRRMVLTHELKGRNAARPLAEEYLRRFPKGSYAGSARALCLDP